jgi:chromosome segregation ATPase
MNVVQRIRGKQEAKEMIERRPLAPAVQQHIESIEQLYTALENAERLIEQYKSATNQANVEIRAQRLELDTLRDLYDNEAKIRQHYERLSGELSVSLENVQDQIDAIFKRVSARMAEAKVEEQKSQLPPKTDTVKDDGAPVPKFLLQQDKFAKEVNDKSS